MIIKDKGFTLVEVIATMTILGIIMLLAIPNINGVIEKNRAKTYVEDAKKMIALAKYKVAKGDNKSEWTLEELDSAKEIDKGPYGYQYLRGESKVVYRDQVYKVTLLENMAGTYSGISQERREDELYSSNPVSLISKFNTREPAIGGDTIDDNTYTDSQEIPVDPNDSYYG